MRFVYLAIAMLAGCGFLDPCGGPEYLNFELIRHGMLPDGTPTFDSGAPNWSGMEMMKTVDEIEVAFPKHDALSSDVLELYAADQMPVAFVGEDQLVPTTVEGCEHEERDYALTALPAGDYTLVHRRKNGTGDPLNCIDLDCPWTTFDGDQAVTLTLAIR